MAKHNRLYKDSPKVERDEDGKLTVKKNTGPTKADGEDMGTEGNPIPGSDGKMPINNGEGDDEGNAPEKEMYDRHHREIKEAHARHEDELKQIHKRHEKEVKKKNKETHAEKDDEETEAEEAAASKED